MWKREPAKPEMSVAATVPQPADTTETVTRTGRVIRKTPHLSNAYTYFHVAIIVKPSDNDDDLVFEENSSGGRSSPALCEVGDEVTVKLTRKTPEDKWSLESFVIVYDIKREKEKLEKLN